MSLTPRIKKILWAVLFIAIAFVLYGLWMAAHPTLPPFQGQMEARVINVSAKISGRIEKVLVKEGDTVKADDVLLEIATPEINAKLGQVKAQSEAAQAKSRLVNEGARSEQVEAAKAQFKRAKAQATLAKKSFARIDSLFKEGLVSAQKHDEARAALDNATNAELAAKSQYDIAVTGARADEKVAAAALASQAKEGVAEVQSLANEAKVRAPRAGEVSRIVLEAGEVTGAGFPLVTLIDLNDQWAIFNIREDEMQQIKMGGKLNATIPALSDKAVEFQIYFISPRADYATWRSTKQSSGYDMRTFEVRARPVTPVEGLRPGMSVLVAR